MSGSIDAPTKGYSPLADYLRRNPEGVNLPPEQLASRFGLPVEQVRAILGTVRERSERRMVEADAEPRVKLKPAARKVYDKALKPSAKGVWKAWTSSTAKPIWFVGLTTALALLCGWFFATGGSSTIDVRLGAGIYRFSQGILLVAVLGLQMACYFRHGMIRYALYGALMNWVIIANATIVALWWRNFNSPTQDENIAPLLVAITFALLLLSGVYGLIGMIAAVLGGYVRVRAADRKKIRLSRQELLERLFEIEERLREGPSATTLPGSFLNHPIVNTVRKRPCLSGLVIGLSLGLIEVVTLGGLSTLRSSNSQFDGTEISVIVFGVIFAAAWLISQASLAFLSQRFARAFAACTVLAVASWLPSWLPLPGYGPTEALSGFPGEMLGALFAAWVIAGIGSLGAAVEDRALQEVRLRNNDPGALLAEMLDIQHMLSPSRTSVCIMVVDVARSSDMKTAADPLVVEYSFREYQEMVQAISETYGGTVHSTAGDGAVVGFPSSTQALAAAKKIQTEIAEFNRETNRLKSPFRLRIGLHQGHVAGELEKIQFTEVIDIAAHVQDAAPVGGIAVTALVASDLETEPLAQLKDPVDGHDVLVVLNPTVDH